MLGMREPLVAGHWLLLGFHNEGDEMDAILIRIGIDLAYGAWNSPVDSQTGEFVYVPIPDGDHKQHAHGDERLFGEVASPLCEFMKARGLGWAALDFPEKLRERRMHLDPDFEHLTYGDNGSRRGSGVATLRRDDLLVFYAGMRSIPPTNRLVYALVGLFVVAEVVPALSVAESRRSENAHTRWPVISSDDIVVRAKRGVSGRLNRCIPIGEWRERAYRVCPSVEESWGGLSVKNGYIQRSGVPPHFRDAERFYSWFLAQNVKLLERNN